MRISRRKMLLGTAASASLAAIGGALALSGDRFAAASAWRLPAKRPFRIIENEWIPMQDGVRLAARIWMPEGAETHLVPVVWEYLPYRLWDDLRWRDDKTGENLAPYGITFVRVDIRGTGNSEGVMVDEYDVPELTDGVQIIAWLARQPWSNGSVGMRGISWGGINALQIAAMAPPELKAIMPMGCVVNRFTGDAHYMGGAYGEQNMGWGTAFKGDMAAPPDPQVVGAHWEPMWRQRLEATPAILRTWSTHQRYDAYWKRGSIATDYAAIKCPVYVVDGWGDPYESIIGELLTNLKVPRKGLIGPWGHIFPNLATPIGLDWPYEEVRWWQHWLGGTDTGIMEEPMLRVYLMYQADSEAFPSEVPGRWVAEAVWPSPRIASTNLYFDAGGRLSANPGSRDHVKYIGNKIVGLTKPQWGLRTPNRVRAITGRSQFAAIRFRAAGPRSGDPRLSNCEGPSQRRRSGREDCGPPDGSDARRKILAGQLQRTQSDSPRFNGTANRVKARRVLRYRVAFVPDRASVQEGQSHPSRALGEPMATGLALAADCDA
jgi:hypothetical protein